MQERPPGCLCPLLSLVSLPLSPGSPGVASSAPETFAGSSRPSFSLVKCVLRHLKPVREDREEAAVLNGFEARHFGRPTNASREEVCALMSRPYVVVALFLTYAVGIAAPCYCATHGSGGQVAADSHSCCQTDTTAAQTSVRPACCCDDREEARVNVVIPDPQTQSAPVVVAIIDAVQFVSPPCLSIEAIPLLNDVPPPILLPGSTPDLRAPPA